MVYQRENPEDNDTREHIIIVGAGIIGVCTAYFLVKHPKFDPKKYRITLLESKRVAGGASGKAGGLLALWAFPQQIVPLSFQLHQELSDEYNGAEEWGYRRLTTVSLEGDISGVMNDSQSSERREPREETVRLSSRRSSLAGLVEPDRKCLRATRSSTKKNLLPKDLNWIDASLMTGCHSLGGTDSTAQVHPYKFTTFILNKAIETSGGALELVIGKVSEITYSMETGMATGIKYTPSSVKAGNLDKLISLNGDKILLTVGPWTSRILPDCPISGLRAHSITISPYEDQPVSPYAIFTELKTDPYSYISPEIYARKDEVYVCGEADSAVEVPETTDDVEIVKSKCDELFKQVGKISFNLRKGHILKRQACYLPVLDVPSSSGPLIGETNVDRLYLCSGHSCWGINNAPGSGKIMSELLLEGKARSADISSLDPSLYFDASVLIDEGEYEDGEEENYEADDSSSTSKVKEDSEVNSVVS